MPGPDRPRSATALLIDEFAPRIEGIVDDESVSQHLMVVRKIVRKPQRNRQQTCCLWSQIKPVGVRPTDDNRQISQSGVSEVVFAQKGVKAAELSHMAQFHP